MSRILFVDDDPNILRGLRDGLRRNRRTWAMTFVDSGAAALEFLRENETDVIVSDMRMPAMDGADLLDQVRLQYPQMTRLVLSGHSQREQLARASVVAHQYLSKPCDAQALREALTKLFDARNRSINPAAREMVGRLNGLPSVGAMHQELMQCTVNCANPNDAMSILLARDADLALRVAELAGLAYPETALNMKSGPELIDSCGFEAVRAMSVAALVAADIERSGMTETFDWLAHSARSARMAQELTQREELKELAFASGFLHDIGIIVHWLNDPHGYVEQCLSNEVAGEEICRLETEYIGVDHSETGGLLLESWGFNPIVARACALHHQSDTSAGDSACEITATVIAESIQKADQLLLAAKHEHHRTQAGWPAELDELWRHWSADSAMSEL